MTANMMKRRLFIDMDGVIVDFDKAKFEADLTGEQIKKMPGAYFRMDPIPGALEAVHSAIGMGYDVWLATKPPTGYPHAYADKVAWVLHHIPDLKRKIILTHDKGLLGGEADILVDDRPHKANCESFRGHLVHHKSWEETMKVLRFYSPSRPTSGEHISDIFNGKIRCQCGKLKGPPSHWLFEPNGTRHSIGERCGTRPPPPEVWAKYKKLAEEWARFDAERKAYEALPWWKRTFKSYPMMPELMPRW